MSHAAHGLGAPRILLIGLDEDLVSEILRALPECDVRTASVIALETSQRPGEGVPRCDVIFCPAGSRHLLPVLEKASPRRLPVVAVTRHPDSTEWLNAIEAGAADYAAPPFESSQLRWILHSNLRRTAAAGSG
ncbi:MAG: response regulator [Bryobacterales bacterium]|nr:response regulator [Bryobacterales bacterium]